ncbi:23S rRNA (cytidine(2498)-2'-O)-methyltransferase RlmM [Lysobacter sp. GX 14042]|uniref:23S rRNA (cytidine(2498)-2'-O)-methyltransferase RlmM n=1 Tax=Lysobacter sp. GX 14042 TaxID=2907155 RepID=UPI001F2F0471|nr:23S rRNA (cytidine(2498)-2'-O)-methyltransferase RlmM [Lysobacter sp. GX 14042]MCE7031075.1 23S rRNA (cytidine(2498)-2'-O)-methyltransferase RlmM [Lysobacter sp. GX 14042]
MGDGLLCFCRAGFEPELAAELGERAALAGHPGHARTSRGSGLVEFFPADGDATGLDHALRFRDLVFARQKLLRLAELRELEGGDRVGPVLRVLDTLAAGGLPPFGQLWVEHADSDDGRPLAGLARSFGNALRPALRKAGRLTPRDEPAAPRLHVVLLGGRHLLLARSHPADSAPWPLGIPRLRMHPDAPSRSALKLEEALLVLLAPGDRERLLREGMQGADLGAAPGGWSWVLARHGLMVTAVDNGPMHEELLAAGRVRHVREDGFRWQPRQKLDWMVCDMVEQPRRVAARMAEWFANDWCRRAVFNLKLPMKKRWDETRLCLDLFTSQAGYPVRLRARQLYHDREEITVYASSVD